MFEIGDKVLITKRGGTTFIDSDLPLKSIVIDIIKLQNIQTGLYEEIYYIVQVTDKIFIKKIQEQGGIALKYRFTANCLIKDNVCSVCNQEIELYSGDRKLIAAHHFNGSICYGSHRPIDL